MDNQIVKQAVVVTRDAPTPNQLSEKIALFDANGNPLSFETAATMLLTGYAVGPVSNLAATDTVTEAFGKVQALIFNLQSRVEALEAA